MNIIMRGEKQMANPDFENVKRRIKKIRRAEEGNKTYLRRHRIGEYLPGQVIYNLGDYPKRFSIEPTEYDFNLLKDMAENGVKVLQVHEEWNDAIRHLGADKFSSHDHEGMKNFVKLCHSFGIKILPYVSTGYFDVRDPDFKESFSRSKYGYHAEHLYYRKCYAGSPEWRTYLLPKLYGAVETYGFDGIFNDWGYDGGNLYIEKMQKEGKDLSGEQSLEMPYDPELEDLLSEIYLEIKRRGGIVKIHCDRNNKPPCKDKVYDYIWIGECVKSDDFGAGKDYDLYVVPCEHGEFSKGKNPDLYYVKTIPFMQFPLLKRGRPLMGSGIYEKGVDYVEIGDFLHHKKVGEYMKDHPNGPFVYSLWSTIPDDTQEYSRWCRYMKLYEPMVKQNSVAYIELKESSYIVSLIPDKVCVSMFVNEEEYMVASNLGTDTYELVLKDEWTDRVSGENGKIHKIKPDTITFLKKI